MRLLALEFPPISHLVEWEDLLFEGTIFAMNKIAFLAIAAAFITGLLFFLAGRRAQLVPTGVQNLVEVSVEFVRDQVIMQTFGPHGMAWMPLLLAIFFFVLFCNMFELIPGVQMPASARMAIPGFLAILVWLIYNVMGIKEQGFFGYLKSTTVPPGVPKGILPLVAFIFFVSHIIVQPFSLAVRLFANMLAGHLLLVTFAVLSAALFTKNLLIAIMPITFAVLVAMTAFELLVAFLQAYIFTILTAVYIQAAVHPEH